MEFPLQLVIIVVAAVALGGVFAWLAARRDGAGLVAATLASIAGLASGAFILNQANQPGMASLNGFLASVALGLVVIAVLIVAALRPRVRVAALAACASLVLSAVIGSQLLVLL
jgi:hypothetical protein